MNQRLFSTFFFVLLVLGLNAQIEQGTQLVGGTLSVDLAFDKDDEADEFIFTPRYGVFVVDRIALGGSLGIGFQKRGADNSETVLTLGPFARLYILGNNNLKMLIDARTSYIYARSKVNDVSSTDHGFQFFGGPGLSYFMNDNVSLDVILGYNYRSFGEEANSSNLRLVAGFQIYL